MHNVRIVRPTPGHAAGRPVAALPAWARLVVSGLVVLLLGLLIAPPAAADSLIATEPLDRQELDAAPGWVTLAFDREIDPGSAKVLVQDPQGRNTTVGQLIVEGTNVTTQLEDGLPRGTYTVRYRVATTDEPFGGAFQFSYGPGSFTTLPDRSWSGSDDEPPVLSNDDPNATTSAPPPSPRPRESEPGVEVSKGGSSPAPEPSASPTGSSASSQPSSPAPTSGATPAPTPSGSLTPAADPESSDDGVLPAAAVVSGVVVLAAGAGALLWWRRRRGSSGPEA